MGYRWDFVIPAALIFLIPGVWTTIGAAINVSKRHRHVTTAGMVLHVMLGVVLTAVGVAVLLGFGWPWSFLGFVAIGMELVVSGTRRLYLVPPSGNLQRIYMVGGIVLLAVLGLGMISRY